MRFVKSIQTPLPVLFLHEDGVREPVRVERFSDEASLEYVIDFVADGVTPFFVHSPRLLFHRLRSAVGELVTDDFGIDSLHIGGRPREDVYVL